MFTQRALLLGAVVSLPLAATAEPSPAQRVLIDCAGKGVIRPSAMQISCADGGIMVSEIR